MYVKVVVYAGVKKEVVKEMAEGRYEVRVKEPAEQNLANTRVRQLMAEQFQVPLGQVRIISGHHSSRKILSVGE
jgi:uncharacterized protein YggU (UPF0235/DUF167 family)